MITEINVKKSLLAMEVGSSEGISIFSKEFFALKIRERPIALFILAQKFRENSSRLKRQKKGEWKIYFKDEIVNPSFNLGNSKIKILKITRIS